MPLQKKLTNNVVNLTNGELIGGGGRITRTTLYTGNATGTNQIELTDSIENYDVLVIYFSFGSSAHAYAPLIVDTDFLIENCPYKSTPSYTDGHMIISLNDEDGQWGRVLCGEDNAHLLIWLENVHTNMIRIDGIKF